MTRPDSYWPDVGCYGVSDVNDVIHAGVWWQRSFGRGRPLALFGNSYGGYLSLMALARRDSPFCGAEDDTHSLARHRPEVRRRSERFLAQLAMH